jgi:c-di-GMP-binding flagellar brake protein YcgR
MSRPNDKRRHPRVAHRLRVKSKGREALDLETIDLSAGGLRCSSPVFIAPMTRMAVALVLPDTKGSPGIADQHIHGEAVVVRTEPPAHEKSNGGGYRVALFFSRMDEGDRQKLQNFLKDRAGKSGHA